MMKTMVGGAMMVLLMACGADASTEGAEQGTNAPAAAAGSNESSATTGEQRGDDNGTPGASTPAPAPAPAPTPAPADEPAPAPKPAPADCSTRTGGAIVTFSKGNETWTVWITNADFEKEAFLATAYGKSVTPVFTGLHDGVDCDGQFTWHVDAADVAFDTDYDPSCDALPSVVEADKATWLAKNRWCPSKVMISSYQGK
jgi:hypothetical protein